MKGNMKKLPALVGAPVIALFIMVVMASAGPAIPHGINGEYAVTGFSSCDPTSPGIMEGDYTFSNDGTGSFSGFGRNIGASGGSFIALTADFHYTVTKEGRIEFQYPFPPGGVKVFTPDGKTLLQTMNGGPSHGFISPDGKTITITCGPPVYLKVIDPDSGATLFEPVWCVTTLAGMRLN
ncbi:MAG TPA: hypothetical protein VLK23_13465 [Thermodesulfobacteriota bacterium]|nr:hypothetical protein [Thermodesulfobacteriota bacterium]